MLFQEVSYERKSYMYTAVLDNGVTVVAYTDGTGDGFDGNKYRIVSHIEHDEEDEVYDEVVVDGWELIENI